MLYMAVALQDGAASGACLSHQDRSVPLKDTCTVRHCNPRALNRSATDSHRIYRTILSPSPSSMSRGMVVLFPTDLMIGSAPMGETGELSSPIA